MNTSKKKYTTPTAVAADEFESKNSGQHLVPILAAAASAAGYAAGRALTNAIRIDSFTKVNGLIPVLKAS